MRGPQFSNGPAARYARSRHLAQHHPDSGRNRRRVHEAPVGQRQGCRRVLPAGKYPAGGSFLRETVNAYAKLRRMSDSRTSNGAEEFARLAGIIRELRERCPWDREQTITSLAKHLVEEAYEALDAIERGAPHEITDELGDLLSQVLAITVIGEEERRIDIAAILTWA